MRSSGFVRAIDQLGRLTLPMEWRRTFDISNGSPIEIVTCGDGSLTLRRYVPGGACTFCGETDQISHFAGRPVCRSCAVQLGAATVSP